MLVMATGEFTSPVHRLYMYSTLYIPSIHRGEAKAKVHVVSEAGQFVLMSGPFLHIDLILATSPCYSTLMELHAHLHS